MKSRMEVSAQSVLIAVAMLMAGCVTINIYFPASAAEKAADKIIDEVWQSRGEATPATAPSTTPTPPAIEKTEKP